MKPFRVDRKTGTNRGTACTYGVHGPLRWVGVGVTPPGRFNQRVGVDDVAPTLAHLLGLLAPPLSRVKALF